MITLITGLPGNGKTLYALTWLKAKAEKEGRPVYYSGITDCMVPGWIELPAAEEWPKLPAGSIVLIDEVQRVMRPRQHGTSVPDHIAKLETHRHMGVDLVLVTQHPMLLDSNVRRLVGQHFHVMRKFGTHMATVHEWSAAKESCDKNRDDSIRHEWRYPKSSFALYKSAELHTHKRRIPMKVWVLLALPLVVGSLGWYTWTRMDPSRRGAQAQEALAAHGGAAGAAGASATGTSAVKTASQYVAAFAPRIPGLAYTAPVYDELTKPTEVPYPAACVAAGPRCQCYTQQGTRLTVPPALCAQIAEGGFFVAWKGSTPVVAPRGTAVPVSPAPEPVLTAGGYGLVSLGGSRTSHFTAQTSTPASTITGNVDQAPRSGPPASASGAGR